MGCAASRESSRSTRLRFARRGVRSRGTWRRNSGARRASGEWIERAFVEGARESGALVESAGVITTPGVAFLVRALPADAGVVVSASHNPFQDNGIKIFAPDGRKLDDATERQIEADIYAESERGAAHDAGVEEKRSGEVAAKVDKSNAGINVAG